MTGPEKYQLDYQGLPPGGVEPWSIESIDYQLEQLADQVRHGPAQPLPGWLPYTEWQRALRIATDRLLERRLAVRAELRDGRAEQ